MNKKLTLTLILVVSISTLFVCTSLAFDENKGPPLMQAPQPKYDLMPEVNFGLLPPPIDLTHIGKTRAEKTEEPPSQYDLRDLGEVTPVKNQKPCGTCWAFATTGSLESRILVEESITYDLSEQCIVACNIDDTTCDSGGNIWISSNYLSKRGSHLESDYPYTCQTDGCGDPDCICTFPVIHSLTGWRLVCNKPDTNAIKNAVNNYGGVYCAMNASFPGFSSYVGTGVLYYTGNENCTHAVTIIGWDDDMQHAVGNGAWIAKNSWGTAWGNSGYFYIAYGSARIGTNASYMEYKDYDPDETLLYYDDYGLCGAVGYGDNTAWAAVRFTPDNSCEIMSVDFWATDDNMSYDIYFYDNWTDGAPADLLHSQLGGSLVESGYYSIPLTIPVSVTSGDEFVVVIKFIASDYGYPVPIDEGAPIETNKCYLSSSGRTWTHAGGYGWDIGIRARIETIPACKGDFDEDGDVDGVTWQPLPQVELVLH